MRKRLGSIDSGETASHPRALSPTPPAHERLLALQRSAGNAAVTAALNGSGTVVAQRVSGTGLAEGKTLGGYAHTVSGAAEKWANLSVPDRIDTLLGPANEALAAQGVPAVKGALPVGVGSHLIGFSADTHAAFSAYFWNVTFNPDLLKKPFADDAELQRHLGRLANTTYHECRHAEQVFRVARKLAGEGCDAKKIQQRITIRADVATEAVKNPLKKRGNAAEWAEAEAWQLNIEMKPNGNGKSESLAEVVNKLKDKAVKEFYEVRTRLGDLTNATVRDDKAIAAAENDYRIKHERAKQAFLQYASMPVEHDAWETGGRIQEHLGLEVYTAESEIANLGEEVKQLREHIEPGVQAPALADFSRFRK